MWTSDDDELKALLAIGILAGFALLFQLEATHISIVTWLPANPSMRALLSFSKFVVLGLFGLYIATFTMALGFSSVGGMERIAKGLKYWTDIVFAIGGFFLFFLFIVYLARVVLQT